MATPGSAPGQPVVPWLKVALQLLALVWFSLRLKSATLFMFGALWFGYRVLTRKYGWPGFLVSMFIIAVVSLIVRSV
jgi:hypothetical protein